MSSLFFIASLFSMMVGRVDIGIYLAIIAVLFRLDTIYSLGKKQH